MGRTILGERHLAIAALAYTWVAVICWPNAYASILTHYIAVYVIFLPPIGLIALAAGSVFHRPFGPIAFCRNVLANRGLPALAILIISCVSVAAFTTYKSQIVVPFFADKFFADIDDALHMGQPWRVLREIVPHWLSWVMALAYGPGWFLECLLVIFLAAFMSNGNDRRQYFVCLSGSMLFLGTILRVVASSGGPIFYDRLFGADRFAELTHALSSTQYGSAVLRVSDYLYESHMSVAPKFGAGISAMPSMHVALAILNALFLTKLSIVGGIMGWTFASLIILGSVYFGWHYAVDAYVSALCVVLGWAALDAKVRQRWMSAGQRGRHRTT